MNLILGHKKTLWVKGKFGGKSFELLLTHNKFRRVRKMVEAKINRAKKEEQKSNEGKAKDRVNVPFHRVAYNKTANLLGHDSSSRVAQKVAVDENNLFVETCKLLEEATGEDYIFDGKRVLDYIQEWDYEDWTAGTTDKRKKKE